MKKHIILATMILALATQSFAKRINEYDAVDAFADTDKILISDTSASGREKTLSGTQLKTYIGTGVAFTLGSLSDLKIDIGATDENLLSATPADKDLQTYTAAQIDTLLGAVESVPTIQADDPTSASANGWYLATTSGDLFYISDGGMFTIAGAYAAWDTSPTAFTFTDETGVDVSTLKVSDTKTVAGIDRTAPISVTGSTGAGYKIGAAACTDISGTIALGDNFNACVTSSSLPSTATTATVTIGGVSDTYSVTTAASFVCSETPTTTQDTSTGSWPLGSSVGYYYISAPAIHEPGTFTACAIDFYLQRVGTLTGKTLYVEKWSYNEGTVMLGSKIADLGTIDASALSTSAEYVKVSFGESVSISDGETIILTLRETIDASNYVAVYYAGSLISDQMALVYSNSKGYTAGGYGNDLRVKYYNE